MGLAQVPRLDLVSFFCGAMIFSIAMRTVGSLRRGTLFVSFLIQTCLMTIAVALIQANLSPTRPRTRAWTEVLCSGADPYRSY